MAGASIVPIPWEHLLGFAGLWLAIYGGGHTIKSVLGRQARAAVELGLLPDGSGIAEILADYSLMRDQARACR